MKRIIQYLILLSICSTRILLSNLSAQTSSSFDGIEIRILDANRNTYYFGEPFRIYYEIKNVAKSAKSYYAVSDNLKYELKNTKTGEIIKPRGYTNRESMTEKQYIKANFQGYGNFLIGEEFGTVKLTDKKVTGHSIIQDHLAAIPVGEYELILRYFLLPSDKVILAKHSFKVVEPPSNLKEVRDQYLKCVYYANETGYDGSGTYSASHVDSYENFLKKYSNNIFTEYARIDMTIAIYAYPGPTSEEMIKKRKEYLNFFPQIKHNDVKFYYALKLPNVLYQIVMQQEVKQATQDVLRNKIKKLSDDMLRNKMKDSYYASAIFIHNNPSLTELRNYAIKEK